MRNRRKRDQIEEALRSAMPWDEVFVADMEPSDRDLFERRMSAIDLYVHGTELREIIRRTKIRTNDLHRLISRCLSIADDGSIWGARALIPNFRIKAYRREAPMRLKLPEQKGGYAGALGHVLMRYPALKDILVGKVLKLGRRRDIQEFRVKPQTLHRIFIEELKALGHPTTEWPFNTKYLGSRSISNLMRRILEENFDKHVNIYQEGGARAHLSVGTGEEAAIKVNQVYEAWEVDSHRVDAEFSIGVRNADGLISYVNVKRLNILALVERASTAVLWFLVVYNSEVSASDVVRLITECLRDTLPTPESNLLGMQVKGDAGYPSEKIPRLKHALPGILMPDNALSNLAASVSLELRHRLGFYLNYGPPGHFEARPNVERTFKNIAEGIFQRMPNTTGSSPTSGRAKNGADVARRYQIEADIVEELAYHHFSQHNALESEGIGFLTPLEFLRQKLALANDNFIPRRLLRSQIDSVLNYRTVRKVTVKCYPERGIRPYVQLDRVRYSNTILKRSPWLKNTMITVEIDEQDYRSAKAYFPDGASMGTLTASGKWSRTKHSRKTRIAINQLRSERILALSDSDDPIEFYLKYLHSQAVKVKSSAGRNPDIYKTVASRSAATEISRVNHEIGRDRPDLVLRADGQLTDGQFRQPQAATDTQDTAIDQLLDLTTDSAVESVMPTPAPDLKSMMKGF